MKKQKDYSLLAFLIILAIAVLASSCSTYKSGGNGCWKGKEPRYQNKHFRN